MTVRSSGGPGLAHGLGPVQIGVCPKSSVNDDVVDVIINPDAVGRKALVAWRPQSAAFDVKNKLITAKPDMPCTLELSPEIPDCFGSPGCSGKILA